MTDCHIKITESKFRAVVWNWSYFFLYIQVSFKLLCFQKQFLLFLFLGNMFCEFIKENNVVDYNSAKLEC